VSLIFVVHTGLVRTYFSNAANRCAALVLQDFYHVSGRFRERFIVPGATLDSVEQHLDIVDDARQIL